MNVVMLSAVGTVMENSMYPAERVVSSVSIEATALLEGSYWNARDPPPISQNADRGRDEPPKPHEGPTGASDPEVPVLKEGFVSVVMAERK
ncbi:hypothetical protein ACIPJK_39130 [Streptomyces roseus]|uniref:hypothetical protein n=1 Tax=Streptomyces roseus TaxID=66430 RepID=UPI00382177D9